MVTRDDLESYLIRMDLDFEEVDDGMFLVHPRNDGPPVVVHHSPPLLVVRLKIMTVPKGKDLGELFRSLLVWNATDVVHGAYGIEEDDLVLTDTLELETLDFPELQASLESMQMASASHINQIKALAGTGQEG
ncbi:MAG: YbjN domain-containing protein [Longimicrobiales bacterium]|nr:YbjN domain-containing protein [Longimicrobiales bacterium]